MCALATEKPHCSTFSVFLITWSGGDRSHFETLRFGGFSFQQHLDKIILTLKQSRQELDLRLVMLFQNPLKCIRRSHDTVGITTESANLISEYDYANTRPNNLVPVTDGAKTRPDNFVPKCESVKKQTKQTVSEYFYVETNPLRNK